MIKVKVIEEFTLQKFDELKNIKRNNPANDEFRRLYVNDIFECTKEMAEYLTNTNAEKRAFVQVIEIVPEDEVEKNTVTIDNAEDTEKTKTKRTRKTKTSNT